MILSTVLWFSYVLLSGFGVNLALPPARTAYFG